MLHDITDQYTSGQTQDYFNPQICRSVIFVHNFQLLCMAIVYWTEGSERQSVLDHTCDKLWCITQALSVITALDSPFAASLAMIKTLCSTNTILDIIEKVIRRVSI